MLKECFSSAVLFFMFVSLTGFDEDTYRRSIVPMTRLTHCVRLPPLVNLYRERMVQYLVKYNTWFVWAPLSRLRDLDFWKCEFVFRYDFHVLKRIWTHYLQGMRQTRQKNLLPFCRFCSGLCTINASLFCFFSVFNFLRVCVYFLPPFLIFFLYKTCT